MSAKLVDLATGMVSRRVFADEAIYQDELDRVFARCWLFLGHEAMIPAPHDYVTGYMGEDGVIVCRDAAGQVRAFSARIAIASSLWAGSYSQSIACFLARRKRTRVSALRSAHARFTRPAFSVCFFT